MTNLRSFIVEETQVSPQLDLFVYPIEIKSQIDGMTVLSIAPLIARAIREVFEDGSVTSLFDGAS